MLSFFILLFWIITFGASAIEKLADSNGTRIWLEGYLKETPFAKWVRPLLVAVVFAESVATLLCGVGLVFWLLIRLDTQESYPKQVAFSIFSQMGIWIGMATLLCFLVGQRWAKDYQGARGMALYILIGFFSLYVLGG